MGTSASAAVQRCVEGLLAYGPEKIILFGSAALGDTDEYSDIDLIIVKETEARFVQRLVEVMDYLPRDVPVDAFVYTPQEFQAMQEGGNPFIAQALDEGIVLYEKAPGNG